MLERDHRQFTHLFAEIRKADGQDRRRLVAQVAADLRLHMAVEESIVYPLIEDQVGAGHEVVEEAKTDHDEARRALADVERLASGQPGFGGALAKLEAEIAQHVEEEETAVFPELREAATPDVLERLGERVAGAKVRRPHPAVFLSGKE
jgi:iron-sulfur cluster repair protein YtfE (RIC family)